MFCGVGTHIPPDVHVHAKKEDADNIDGKERIVEMVGDAILCLENRQ